MAALPFFDAGTSTQDSTRSGEPWSASSRRTSPRSSTRWRQPWA